jgi:hypothetical protein
MVTSISESQLCKNAFPEGGLLVKGKIKPLDVRFHCSYMINHPSPKVNIHLLVFYPS